MSSSNAQAGPWSAQHVDAASHGAVAFTQIYYEAYDEPARRVQDVPQLYIPGAKVIWNGNPVVADPNTMAAFLEKMPLSRHDVQSVDCHPVAMQDPSAPSNAPDLLVNVTGSVLHGPHVILGQFGPAGSSSSIPPHARSNAGGSASGQGQGQEKLAPQDHPRKFHEMFVLRQVGVEAGVQPKYAIYSSNFRFIG